MTRTVPQHWLLFVGPDNTGLAVQLELDKKKNGEPFFFSKGPVGERLDIELKSSENDNSALTGDLENSAKNGGSYGYAFLQSEGHLRNEASFRFQFEKKYLNGDVLQNVSGASADLLFGLAVVTAVRSDLEYRPFAATGILSDGGQVQPIEGLQAKIRAALNTPALRGSGVIFYPKANDKDIDAELRYEVKRAQIALKPVESLEEAVEYLGITIQGHWIDNPYRRLDVFEYRHRRIFFGREDVTESLAIKLSDRATLERPSLLILGPSGAGKSSLVQAGLIPELEKKLKEENLSLLYSIFDLKSAANKDIQAIAASIRSSWGLLPSLTALAVSNASKQQVAVTPSDVFEALVCDLIAFLPDQTRFVWVLDQLEQFFTLGLTKEADAAFIHLLRELQARGIWIVATFRNDFYSDLRAHDGISNIFDKDGVHDLEKPGETAIERIIQAPAELARLEFEKDDRTSELLSLKLKNDALKGGKDILPLLEFALDQLFEKRELKNGRTQLTWAAYKAMDGLQGAIGKRADEVLNELDPTKQETLGRVLRALAKLRRDAVETEGEKSTFIASVANIEDFPLDTPARRLIDAFAHEKARLFSHDSDNKGNAQVRVTHEALFTHWSTAREILKESMKDMVVRDRLADREADWKLNEEHASKLLPAGLPLEEAQDLLARRKDEKFLSPEIIHFIERSSSADQERKLKESEAQRLKTRLTTITAIVLGILLVVAIGAIYYVNEARNEQAQMLASSYFSEGARLVDDERSNEALAYLARAIRLDSKDDTAAARLAASQLLTPKYRINISNFQIRCNNLSVAQLSLDESWLLAVCGDTTVKWSAITGKLLEPLEDYEGLLGKQEEYRWWSLGPYIEPAQFSIDGYWVVKVFPDKTARVSEVATGVWVSPPIQHQDYIRSAQFSPERRWLVTISGYDVIRREIQVWEAATGKPVSKLMLQNNEDISSVQFSPDERWVVTASWDGTARVWDAITGEPISQPMRHKDIVNFAQFSPDGRWVVTASNDKTAQVWDAATGEPMSKPIYHDGFVRSVQFSPDGRWVVTASNDKTAQVWDAATGEPISKPMYHDGFVSSVQFSPDGRWVVTGSDDRTARVWKAATGKPVMQPMQHESSVISVQFSFSGRWLVTVSGDKNKIVRIWNATIGESIAHRLQQDKDFQSMQISPDGHWVVTILNDKTARVWDVITGEFLVQSLQHTGRIQSVQFSPDSRWVITVSDDRTVRIWDVSTGEPVIDPLQHDAEIRSVQFSPDSRWMVTVSQNKTQVWGVTKGTREFKLLLSQHKGAIIYHNDSVRSAQFSPDGRWLVTVSGDKNNLAQVWDTITGESATQPMQHNTEIRSVQFSYDGHWLATASWDEARIWKVATGEQTSLPMIHKGRVNSTQFSPDGHWLITASDDKTARVWDVSTGKSLVQPLQHREGVITAQFSPDGRWVVTASRDGTARVWEAATGEPVSASMGHKDENWVNSAQFSPDGRWVVTTSVSTSVSVFRTVRIWEAATGKPVSAPFNHHSYASDVQFNPHSNRIITLSDKDLNIWEVLKLPGSGTEFMGFLERISGYLINSMNVLRNTHQLTTIVDLRSWFINSTTLTPEERAFIYWWLSDPIERTVTPTSKQTVKERVQMLIDHDTIASLNEALDYYPGHPMALAKLAAATWRETKTDQQDDIRPRVALWTNLALKYAPDDTAVRSVAEKVLQDIAQQN